MFSYSSNKNANTQELSNSISFNPIINVGDDNEGSVDSQQRQSQSASQALKDEMTTTASVGVGVGGDGSGGAVASKKTGDNQPMAKAPLDFFADDKTKLYLIGGGALVLLFGGYKLLKKRKKRK